MPTGTIQFSISAMARCQGAILILNTGGEVHYREIPRQHYGPNLSRCRSCPNILIHRQGTYLILTIPLFMQLTVSIISRRTNLIATMDLKLFTTTGAFGLWNCY